MFAAVICPLLATQQPVNEQPREAAKVEPLWRAYVVGLAGDHDLDRVDDYAIAGEIVRDKERVIVVRIRSGADDRLLGEFETRLKPLCGMVLHEPHIAIAADLDGDGAVELGAWDGRGWLIDGRTGAVLRDFGPGATVLGSLGDLDGDGVVDLVVDQPP